MSEWISVEDRLPEVGDSTYIAACGNVVVGELLFVAGVWVGVTADQVTDVTHWQPLPEPPKC